MPLSVSLDFRLGPSQLTLHTYFSLESLSLSRCPTSLTESSVFPNAPWFPTMAAKFWLCLSIFYCAFSISNCPSISDLAHHLSPCPASLSMPPSWPCLSISYQVSPPLIMAPHFWPCAQYFCMPCISDSYSPSLTVILSLSMPPLIKTKIVLIIALLFYFLL